MSRMERAALAKKAKIEDVKSRTGSYPSRSEIHKKKEKKKSPYKYPAVTLLAIFFFCFPSAFITPFRILMNAAKPLMAKIFPIMKTC